MTGAILIVEDEPLIAMMLEDFLEILGHRVVGPHDCVAQGVAAVAAGGLSAAIIDINLRGGETSVALAEALSKAAIPFAIASGHGDPPGLSPAFAGRPTLAKPFTLADVERVLGDLAEPSH
ncbi:MAG: response regulator [Sphingomonas sp.]